MTGGIADVLGKAWRVWRAEGWAGLTSRFDAIRNSPDYNKWIRQFDTLDDTRRVQLRKTAEKIPCAPLISVVMPTYNPDLRWLAQAIESVRTQIYPHWELCIADDASTDPRVRPSLERYARADHRIRVAFRDRNGHISAASNTALAMANGEWVALLDHDDLLAEDALLRVAQVIRSWPNCRLIYSDEDKVDARNTRADAYFKCDWNPELFESQNMFSHLGVYYRSLVVEIGGFREGFEGAQDYDLALRCVERIRTDQIVHIPRVLYHWRVHRKSTARALESKPYAQDAGRRALTEHFERLGIAARVELSGNGYRVRYALPERCPLVTLIIPTRNGETLLRQCVGSILEKTTYRPYEILVVDNGSDEPGCLAYLRQLSKDTRVRVMRDEGPFNYSALNNAAVRAARGEVIGLVNNDVEVISRDWLDEMVSHALRPSVGAVGAKLLFPNDTVQHAGVVLGIGGVAAHMHRGLPREHRGYFERAGLVQAYSAVTAACLVVRKAVYEEVGGLNETDLRVAFNDVDFCLRARAAGYRNVWTPYAELYHHESATRGTEDTDEKRERFAREACYMREQWGALLLADPAYNPNLSVVHSDFRLAWPPRVSEVATGKLQT
ncbi:MAG TPA: glycosyltransferase family 2 protein [Verrucomicrobiae bacterium]|nr:glycosyltransferase family 2 protein [Verrucomicrobiae bacterium]